MMQEETFYRLNELRIAKFPLKEVTGISFCTGEGGDRGAVWKSCLWFFCISIQDVPSLQQQTFSIRR